MYAYMNCFILTDNRQARVLTLSEGLILFLLSTLPEGLTKVLFFIFQEKERDPEIIQCILQLLSKRVQCLRDLFLYDLHEIIAIYRQKLIHKR